MRQLATIRKISSINPIENADRIEVATVDGWECVVQKDEFKQGDLCIYFEIDSILPKHKVFEFMAGRNYKVKTAKFRGQISQGLIMPFTVLHYFNPKNPYPSEGTDVTDIIGVKKYEKYADYNYPAQSAYRKKRNLFDKYLTQFNWYRVIRRTLFTKGAHNFPEFLPKTDEPRVQNVLNLLRNYQGTQFYVTEKLDGMSATYAVKKSRFYKRKFYVCSRNIWLWKENNTEWWGIARKLDIFNKLKKCPYNVAVQGEIMGPKCNGNKLELSEIDFYVFNVINLDTNRRLDLKSKTAFLLKYGFKSVPIISLDHSLNDLSSIKEYSTRNSSINESKIAEGCVFRKIDNDYVSFKCVNPEYLLKYDE